MKINILSATVLAIGVSFAGAASANTVSAADNCILDQMNDVRKTLQDLPVRDSFTAKVTYKDEELAALIRLCEDKTGEKVVTLAKVRELSVTYSPR